LINHQKLIAINRLISNNFLNFVVNAKKHENCKTQVYLLLFIKVENV